MGEKKLSCRYEVKLLRNIIQMRKVHMKHIGATKQFTDMCNKSVFLENLEKKQKEREKPEYRQM